MRRAFMNPKTYHGAALSVAALQREFHSTDDHRMKVIEPGDRVRPGDDLSLMQQIALLSLMPSTLARGVAKKLASSQGTQGTPSFADYCEIRRKGYCTKQPEDRWHSITYEGQQYGKRMLQRICADLEIHHMQVGDVIGDGRDARTYFHCSCGGWGRSFQGNGQFAWRRANNAFHEHWNPKARGVET